MSKFRQLGQVLHTEINFNSRFDGSNRRAILIAPDGARESPFPLVIVPHAASYSAKFTAGYWLDIPIRRGVIAVFPFGHGRRNDLYSVGWRGQIADLASFPDILDEQGILVDRSRIYATGISMGGQESLVLAGTHPNLLAGVAAFNPVIDLSTWFYDYPEAASNVVQEIGGTPEQLPDEYTLRSPINYAETIARVQILIYWDPNDEVVRYQDEKQSGLLYRRVKEMNPDAPITACIHHRGHQWINPSLALDWLLGGEMVNG